MKKWLILIIALLAVSSVHGGFISVEGGTSNGNGFWATFKGIFVQTGCTPSWTLTAGSCLLNDTQLKVYQDANSCGTSIGLPSDNGTLLGFCNYCQYNLVTTELEQCIVYDDETEINISIFDSKWENCCLVTGLTSDCYESDTVSLNRTYFATQVCSESDSVYPLGIAVFVIGIMFWLIYTAGTLNTKNDAGDTVPLNILIKMILYGLAGFVAYVAVQLAYGYALSQQLASSILNTLQVQYSLVLNLLLLTGFLILFGTLGNLGMQLIQWFKEKYDPRRERERR